MTRLAKWDGQPIVVIAPDKFRGSLSARQVAYHLDRGLRVTRRAIRTRLVPLADGGEGVLDVLAPFGFAIVPALAHGPDGQVVQSAIAVNADTVVVELARASGLGLPSAQPLSPLAASSRGTGDLLAAALDCGAGRIILGVGGSACTDGGAGMLAALGARIYDESGDELADGGGSLSRVAGIDLSGLDPRFVTVELVVAADVTNPLTGPGGAAQVYSPQKGAGFEEVSLLEAGIERWATVTKEATGTDFSGVPGAGAAGGVAFAALGYLGATIRRGVEVVMDLVAFPDRLNGATLVITGEGTLDSQSLRGKVPAGVARTARAAGVPTVAVVGRSSLEQNDVELAGIECVYALTDIESDLERCMTDAGRLVEQAAHAVAVDQL